MTVVSGDTKPQHMRKLFFLLVTALVVVSGCSKKEYLNAGDLNGRWTMIEVHNKATGETYGPPSGAAGKVYINFSGNTFSGQTLKNTYSNGTFTLEKGNEINFGNFDMTQVTEDEWGVVFLFMLQACDLQSLFPCKPSVITQTKHNRIRIDTPLKYIVTFKKS